MTARPQHLLRYLITNGETQASNFKTQGKAIVDLVSAAVREGIEMIQLREKSLDSRRLLELTLRCAESVRGTGTRLLVNERFDIALVAGADGVHLSSTSVPVEEVRRVCGNSFIIGVSTHTSDEVIRAHTSGADLAVFGPVFQTPGKPETKGLKSLQNVCERAKGFPVIAIGGIDEKTVEAVQGAGAAGFASIRYLNEELMK